MLASKPTAAEAAEVDVRADRRLGGILPYREKSVAAGNTKIKIKSACSSSPASPGPNSGGNFEATH